MGYNQEYFEIRKNEINEDIKKVKGIINSIEEEYGLIENTFENIKVNHYNIRKNDINNQISRIEKDLKLIGDNYKKYSTEDLFLNKEKLNSFSFKAKLNFSWACLDSSKCSISCFFVSLLKFMLD